MEWRFTRTRLREGYAVADVDAFMELVRSSLDGTAVVSLTPTQVREQQFATVWWRDGYAEDEVDAALDEVEVRLAERAAGDARGPAISSDLGADAVPTRMDVAANRFAEARAEADVKAVALRPALERFELVRRGYARDEVDLLVDRVMEALRGRVRLAPEEVLAVRFDVVWRGYDRAAVDGWCDRVADLLVRRQLGDWG